MNITVKDTFVGEQVINKRIIAGIAAGTETAIMDIRSTSQRITPMDTGALRSTVEHSIEIMPKAVRGELSYGGGGAPYASDVHEGMSQWGTPIENWTTPGTGAKYLSRAAENSVAQTLALIKQGINQSI